ncbi:MAG: hypothetical protein J0H12_00190 [Candidatus Paracaedimonas acanthamoebae]|uniref:Uncharacterized protein n=1 Tax=Candidatus Paracaedimonas acanthamoebae TaxID=244581 RepID=A0A8J7PW59_9PROT|nr:hypothetical protein [Candidatus Paracaedimonas acanthamoebae]
MFSYFIPQKWYLILREDRGEVFIYRWGRLKERSCLKTPNELMEKISSSGPISLTVLIDHESEILETGILPRTSFFDKKSLLINHLREKFSAESLFGGMYLKGYQKTSPFLGMASPLSEAMKTWIVPLRKRGINVHLTFFIIEARKYLLQNLKKIGEKSPLILLLPWNGYLKQMLFLEGEIRHLRIIKQPSQEEYNNQITSYSQYIRRQYHLTITNLPIVYMKDSLTQEIYEDVREVIEIQDLAKEVFSHIKAHRLSQFRMFQFPEFGMFPYKKFIYKYAFFCLLGGIIGGALLMTKNFWIFEKDQKIPQRMIQKISRQVSSKSPLSLYLAAIFYLDEKTWTLWLNGQKITTLQGAKDFGYEILFVTDQQVTLRKINSQESVIILKPNQTFIPHKRCIKEGDWQTHNTQKDIS